MKKIFSLILIIGIIGFCLYFFNTEPKKKINNAIPKSYLKDNMFSKYKKEAYKKIKKMSLDEKIGQLYLVRYPGDIGKEELKKYGFGGYIFFGKDFKDKTKEEVIDMMNELQKNSNIPIITAVDEEGGTVARVSSNPKIRKERFLSPRDLYLEGGMERIKEDTIEKSKLLNELGLNLNLAPVVDISTDESDYMHSRSLGEDSKTTRVFAKTVIDASKNSGVSYTLKHFPGYGNNTDTHKNASIDDRSLNDINKRDLIPFIEGIKSGCEAILISHNVVNSIDPNNPASLSKEVHNLLIKDLNFDGIIITDDLDMGAIIGNYKETIEKAINSLNTLIIVTDYEKSIEYTKKLLTEEKININTINKAVFKILCWKYFKKMFS